MKASIVVTSIFATVAVASPTGWFNFGRSASGASDAGHHNGVPSVFPSDIPSGFPSELGDHDRPSLSEHEHHSRHPRPSDNDHNNGQYSRSRPEHISDDIEHHSRVSSSLARQGDKHGFTVRAAPTGAHGKDGKPAPQPSHSGEESDLEDDHGKFSGSAPHSRSCHSDDGKHHGHHGHHGHHSKSAEESGDDDHSRTVHSKGVDHHGSRSQGRPTAYGSQAAPSPTPASA